MTTVSDCSRLYRAHYTCCELLRDRGYALMMMMIDRSAVAEIEDVDNKNEDPVQQQRDDGNSNSRASTDGRGREAHGGYESLDAFCAAYSDDQQQQVQRDHLTLLARRVEPPHDRIFVFFANDPKVGVQPIRQYQARMTDEKVRRAILVVQDSVTAFAKKELASIAPQFVIEVFAERELLFNATHSDLVPPHTLLSKAQKQKLLDDWKVKEAQLPRINQSDPIARYYGYRRGQVCKIVRRSETAGRYVTYRITI